MTDLVPSPGVPSLGAPWRCPSPRCRRPRRATATRAGRPAAAARAAERGVHRVPRAGVGRQPLPRVRQGGPAGRGDPGPLLERPPADPRPTRSWPSTWPCSPRADSGVTYSSNITIGKGAASDLVQISQPAATPEPVVDPAPSAAADYTTLVSTNFDNDDPGSWSLLQDADINQTVQNGEMVVQTLNPEVTMSMTPPAAAAVSNGFVSARVRVDGNGYAGLIVRSNVVGESRSKYACTISNELMVDCYKQINNQWTALVGPKQSDLVRPNEYNDLVLVAEDLTFTFYVNGEEAATFRNDELTQGEFGLYTEPSDSPFTAFFDDVVIGEF